MDRIDDLILSNFLLMLLYFVYFNKISMRADFYLELNNRKIIIEYHGKQHYIPIEHFGANKI